MLSVYSQLLLSSISTFSTVRVKSSKMLIFSLVSQNSDLSSKLNHIRQHKSRGILGFKNRTSDLKLLKSHLNWDNSAYLQNAIFNENSFTNSEIAIRFMTSKQFRKWSQVMILSPGWPCMQKRQTLIVNFTDSRKSDFLQTTLNIDKLYTVGKNFSSRVWIRDLYLKIRLRLARIHLQSFRFWMKKHANVPRTFIGNGDYHLEEEALLSILALR